MEFLNISAMYAGFFTIILIFLSARVSVVRHKKRVALGDCGDIDVLKAIRVQQNFTEYVPIFLIGLVVLELTGYDDAFIHYLALTMLIGRVFHIIGIGYVENISNKGRRSINLGFRIAGMTLTYLSLFTGGILLIMQV